ncbi:MAG: UPF0236 family protein [Clostridia bacterium]|nr:UPF0236 family protein [Clostridia bacterium]
MGELRYKRTYYSFKDGKNVYLADHLIGIEPNERLSKQLCAELVQYSASMSMQKAANVAGGLVSRQTVNNKLPWFRGLHFYAIRNMMPYQTLQMILLW